jgi:protein TonB
VQRVSGEAPVFPPRAREDGIEGWVDVEFTIDTRGVPQGIRVVGAQPPRTFDRAVLRAIETWRYAPVAEPRAVRMRVRFDVDD